MRLSILVVMMLCVPAMADPPKAPAKPAPAKVKERLELTATVAEIPKPIYYCGIVAFRTVVRFAVISVETGDWSEKDVFVVWLCPEAVVDKVGKKIKLVLEKPTASDQGYVDKFPKTSPRWVVRDWKFL